MVTERMTRYFHEKAGLVKPFSWSGQPYIRLPTNGRHHKPPVFPS